MLPFECGDITCRDVAADDRQAAEQQSKESQALHRALGTVLQQQARGTGTGRLIL